MKTRRAQRRIEEKKKDPQISQIDADEYKKIKPQSTRREDTKGTEGRKRKKTSIKKLREKKERITRNKTTKVSK